MSHLHNHPLRTLAALLVLALVLFLISASGQSGTFWSDGPSWLGTIGWFGFLITALVFVLAAIYSVARAVRRPRRVA